MASSPSISFTADTTDLVAKAAIAKEQVRQYTAEVRKAADTAKQSGGSFNDQAAAIQIVASKLDAATSSYKGYVSQLSAARSAQTSTTTNLKDATAEVHNHGAATEAMVLVHEAMAGRFTKMGGSLMILTSRLAGNSAAMMGLAGAMGVAAMGALHLVEWLDKVHEAKIIAQTGALGSGIANSEIDAQVSKLAKLTDAERKVAGETISIFGEMKGVTKEVMDDLSSDVVQLSQRMRSDLTSAATAVASAWDLDAAAAHKLLEVTRASAESIREWDKVSEQHDAASARSILLKELSRDAADLREKTIAGTKQQQFALEIQNKLNEARARGEIISPIGQQYAQSVATNARTESANRLAMALAHVSDELKAPAAIPWAERTRAALEEVKEVAVKTAMEQHKTPQKMMEAELAASTKFWEQTIQQTREGTKERLEAERSLADAKKQLYIMTAKHEQVEGRKSVEARVAELGAEQVAAGENFAKVMEIEDHKLAILRAAYSENSKQFQEELKHKEELLKNHEVKTTNEALSHLAKQREIDREEVADRQAVLGAEVADRLITKQEEVAQVLGFSEQKHAIELNSLDALMATLNKETEAYRKATDEREALEMRHKRVVDSLRLQMQIADRQDQQRKITEWDRAFSSIETAGISSADGLIKKTTTWQQAEYQVMNSVLNEFLRMSSRLVIQWGATEVARNLISDENVKARVASEQQHGETGWNAILAKWIGLEQSKTLTTNTGATARGASETSGSFISSLGKILGLWGATETSKTIATTTGAGEREIAMAAEAAASVQTQGAAARLMIASDAAVAGAAAFADSAAMGPEGLAVAPEAAAAAYSSVQAFQMAVPTPAAILAVGTSYVPQDMNALIHQGEIVVPKFEADMIRSGQATMGAGSGGGGGGDTHVHVHVNAIDTQSGMQFVQRHMPAIARGVGQHFTRNPSSRPVH
jgi:hypothetical protein